MQRVSARVAELNGCYCHQVDSMGGCDFCMDKEIVIERRDKDRRWHTDHRGPTGDKRTGFGRRYAE